MMLSCMDIIPVQHSILPIYYIKTDNPLRYINGLVESKEENLDSLRDIVGAIKASTEQAGNFVSHTLIQTLPIFDLPRHVVLCPLEPEMCIKGCNLHFAPSFITARLNSLKMVSLLDKNHLHRLT